MEAPSDELCNLVFDSPPWSLRGLIDVDRQWECHIGNGASLIWTTTTDKQAGGRADAGGPGRPANAARDEHMGRKWGLVGQRKQALVRFHRGDHAECQNDGWSEFQCEIKRRLTAKDDEMTNDSIGEMATHRINNGVAAATGGEANATYLGPELLSSYSSFYRVS